MQRFSTLLEKYLTNTATPDEVAEFLRLAREKPHEAQLERLMDEKFKNQYLGLNSDERHEMIEQIVSSGRTRKHPFLGYAAAVAFALLAGVWAYQSGMAPFTDDDELVHENTLSISGRDYVSLPDGSSVILKDGSTLQYRESFGKENRQLSLTGEAFFDVVHDPARPFIVRTGAVTTTVLGTAFNINASAAGQITVTVKRGKVSVADDRHTEVVHHNEQVIVSASREFHRTHVNADSLLPWGDNYFILDRVTMSQAADLIGKRFHVDVIIRNEDLKDCEITAWFLNNEDLGQVVEAISAVRRATVSTKDGKVVIDGGVGCNVDSSGEESKQE